MDILLNNESLIRLSCFVGVLLVMIFLERIMPYRPNKASKKTRWLANLGLVALDTLAVRFLIPVLPAAFALFLEEHQWGLFYLLHISSLVTFLLTIVLLDLMVYGQHVLFHYQPLLWRLHKVHHTDTNLDATSGVRFHPVEILLSVLLKLGVVAILGAPAAGVIAFEVLLNATALFNHSNIKLPKNFDKLLRLFVVTPDMHRVHHSIIPQETNNNFGFNLPWWDRLFKTYKAQPQKGHLNMTIGLKEYPDPKALDLETLLLVPFHHKGT